MAARMKEPCSQFWGIEVRRLDVEGECQALEEAYLLGREPRAPDGKPGRKSSTSMERNSQLLVGLYSLVLKCLENDAAQELFDRAKGEEDSFGDSKAAAFKAGMRAIFPTSGQRPPSETQRAICAAAYHAYRHLVPLALVEGFVRQCGINDIKNRASENIIKDGFEDWVIVRLATAFFHGLATAEEYPREIVSAAKNLEAEMRSQERSARGRANGSSASSQPEDDDGW